MASEISPEKGFVEKEEEHYCCICSKKILTRKEIGKMDANGNYICDHCCHPEDLGHSE
jgi:predicted SprT family Zn-dependent metalloprotease